MMDSKICYICNTDSVFYCQNVYKLKSKHTQTRICVFIDKFMGDQPSHRTIEHFLSSDDTSVCVECLNKIDEYDLAVVTAERVEKELREMLLHTDSMYANKQSPLAAHTEELIVERLDSDFESEYDEKIGGGDSNNDARYNCNGDEEDDDGDSFDNYDDHDDHGDIDYIPSALLSSQNKKKSSPQTTKLIHKCKICNEVFNSLSMLMQHKHLESKPHSLLKRETKPRMAKKSSNAIQTPQKLVCYNCPSCSLEFRVKAEYERHIRSHKGEDEPFKCDMCGLDLKEEMAFTEHKKLHLNVSQLQCVMCKKNFKQKGALVRHMRIHSGLTFCQCDRCGKEFVHKSSLEMHIKAHDDVREKQCPHCPRLFRSTSHLNRHIRIHTGAKPYSCPVCGQKFAQRYNMSVHQRLHDSTVEKASLTKTHLCSFCGVAFARKSRLAEHHQKSHAIMMPHTAIGNDLESNDVKGRSLGHSV